MTRPGHAPPQLQPLALASCVDRALAVAASELGSRPFSAGSADGSEKLLVRLTTLLRNVVCCAAYTVAAPGAHRPHGRPPAPEAVACEVAKPLPP